MSDPLSCNLDVNLITIFIETLTGSTFEMVISPSETIAYIKAKIQRVEGVLASQQHLLFNMKELNDADTVHNSGLQEGSTIKLVLSMRGGPLGTARRVLPLDDIVVKEFVELNRNEIEELPSGSKLAIIVFRDGDAVNMFRVLENTDGSFSPLSPSSPSISSYRYTKSDRFGSRCSMQAANENNKTKSKIDELKMKLEALSLQKKSDKLGKDSVGVECDNNTEDEEEVAVGGVSTLLRFPPIKGAIVTDNMSKNINQKSSKSSQVPTLPKISTQGYHIESTPLPTDGSRPRSSPGKLTEHQICQILSDAGKHRSQVVSHHYTSSTLNRLPQSSSSDIDYESNWTNRGSSVGLSEKQGSVALCSPGPGPSRSLLNNVLPTSRTSMNPLLTENNILTKNLPVNEYKVVSQASPPNMYKLSPITAIANTSNKPDVRNPSTDAVTSTSKTNTSSSTSVSSTGSSSNGVKKKNPRMRCSKCNKKLNISATYTCRCQKIFCSRHRYSEAHACTYDYKKEGRKEIAEANPLVTAPKITKF